LSGFSIRGRVSQDETLGPIVTLVGEVLNLICDTERLISIYFSMEVNDFQASLKWAEDQARLEKEQRYAERVACLKKVLTYPWSCITFALSPSSNSKIPTSMSESDGSIHHFCDRSQASENVQPTVSKAPYYNLAKSSDMVYLRRRSIGNKKDN